MKKQNNPEISVIMSALNADRYIEKCADSISTQTFKNFEFVIVDDASEDSTLKIIKQIQKYDKRIKIIQNKQNIGLAKSLNNAIKIAKGKYIARQDADDYSSSTRLEKQFNFLEENKEISLIGTSTTIIDEEGNFLCERKVPTNPAEIKQILCKRNCIFHGSIMFRKKDTQKIGNYRDLFTYGQDYDLYLRLSEHHNISNLQEPLYFWRFSKKSASFEKSRIQAKFGELAKLFAKERLNNLTESYNKDFIKEQTGKLNTKNTLGKKYEYQKTDLLVKARNFNFNKKIFLKHPSLLIKYIYYSLKKK